MSNSIRAHFDGEHIVLDDPAHLEPNTNVLVTVLPTKEEDDGWRRLSVQQLRAAYAGEEDEYSVELIKKSNAECESQ